MIRVLRRQEPPNFDKDVRQPGKVWLKNNPNVRVGPKYWNKVLLELSGVFDGLCGYSAMYVPIGVVDHYLACNNSARPANRQLAYEWMNFRFAAEWVNSKKGTLDRAVLDPFEVRTGWFEVSLPDLQLRVTRRCPRRKRARAQQTIVKLGLRDDERIVRQRRKWLEEYEATGDIGILERNAPLIAEAVRRGNSRRRRRRRR